MSNVESLQKCLRDKLETMSGFGDERKQISILKKFFAEFDTDGSGNVARKKIIVALCRCIVERVS